MKKTSKNPFGLDRVWIELERPDSEEDGSRLAEKLTISLRRTGLITDDHEFRWRANLSSYTFANVDDFITLEENGFWLPLP